jgi:hypothetical protein
MQDSRRTTMDTTVPGAHLQQFWSLHLLVVPFAASGLLLGRRMLGQGFRRAERGFLVGWLLWSWIGLPRVELGFEWAAGLTLAIGAAVTALYLAFDHQARRVAPQLFAVVAIVGVAGLVVIRLCAAASLDVTVFRLSLLAAVILAAGAAIWSARQLWAAERGTP